MKSKGQNLIEFVIIIALVVIGGIFALTMLGGNVHEMFSKSVDKTSKFDPFGAAETAGSAADPATTTSEPATSTEPSTTTVASTLNIDGVNVNINADGSADFVIEGQTVSLSSDIMNSLDQVSMSTGSHGGEITTEVVKAIAKLIEEHKDEYPDGDVPINMAFGAGTREQTDYADSTGGTYKGAASVSSNSITLSIGSDITIIQKDQSYEGMTTTDGAISVIEGSLADIYGDGNTYYRGKITSSISGMNGETFTSAGPISSTSEDIFGSLGGPGGSWGFVFGSDGYEI
ncbi:MAG: Flp family type IVb pilin [Vampirovibrionia bacterium]